MKILQQNYLHIQHVTIKALFDRLVIVCKNNKKKKENEGTQKSEIEKLDFDLYQKNTCHKNYCNYLFRL